MNDKHSFIIPAAIFTVAVSIAGGFLATQAQAPTAWLRSTPEPTLQAPGNAQINGGLAVGSSATPGADGTITTTGAINTAGGVILNTAGATNGLIVANGNVGIGISTPSGARLHVIDLGGTEDGIKISGTGPTIQFEDTSVGGRTYKFINSAISNGNFGLWDASVSDYRIYVKSDGNVGIGTNNPLSKLDIAGGSVRINGAQSYLITGGYVSTSISEFPWYTYSNNWGNANPGCPAEFTDRIVMGTGSSGLHFCTYP